MIIRSLHENEVFRARGRARRELAGVSTAHIADQPATDRLLEIKKCKLKQMDRLIEKCQYRPSGQL